ncbi:MAG: MFS transporter permease [Desulfobacterales bacterium]|nr:MFS transporter permease [Desulfobacterales bacterium]
MKEIVIPKEKAVFWLDRHGNWHNRHGRFELPRIISKFHAAIGRDGEGYYLSQVNEEVREKIYFHHEDTALFVFDVLMGAKEITLILNTGHEALLAPETLYIQDDALYTRVGGERIRFAERGLLKVGPLLEDDGTTCYFCFGDKRVAIPEICAATPEPKKKEPKDAP